MPQAPLSPADLDGQRRRREPGKLAYVPPDPWRGVGLTVYASADIAAAEKADEPPNSDGIAIEPGIGADAIRHRLAERAAMAWLQPPPVVGPDDLDAAAAADAIRIQRRLACAETVGCEGWPGALPDDGPGGIGLPAEGYGPAEGHALRDPRSVVRRRRLVLAAVVFAVAVMMLAALVSGWPGQDAPPVRSAARVVLT